MGGCIAYCRVSIFLFGMFGILLFLCKTNSSEVLKLNIIIAGRINDDDYYSAINFVCLSRI